MWLQMCQRKRVIKEMIDNIFSKFCLDLAGYFYKKRVIILVLTLVYMSKYLTLMFFSKKTYCCNLLYKMGQYFMRIQYINTLGIVDILWTTILWILIQCESAKFSWCQGFWLQCVGKHLCVLPWLVGTSGNRS